MDGFALLNERSCRDRRCRGKCHLPVESVRQDRQPRTFFGDARDVVGSGWVLLEIRDEHGECQCSDCQVKLDEFGSKSFGRAEITWLQELAREAWKRNPKLKLAWNIGYDEHDKDVAYYEQIRRMNDPRFEWVDCRVGLDGKRAWVLPGPAGQPRPMAFLSRKLIHWDPFYTRSLNQLVLAAKRTADEGLYGYAPAFEPGFGSASYYSDQIPLPVDILPYNLTGFAFREVTWTPGISIDELKSRIQRRYFSPQAPKRLADDMVYLRQFSLDHWLEIRNFSKPRYHYAGERFEPLTLSGELKRVAGIADEKQRRDQQQKLLTSLKKLAKVREHIDRMAKIEVALDAAAIQATPKTLESLQIMRKMITDTGRLYQQAVPDQPALTSAMQRLGR